MRGLTKKSLVTLNSPPSGIHHSIIYNKIGICIILPTTSVFDHSSFRKEENGDTNDF